MIIPKPNLTRHVALFILMIVVVGASIAAQERVKEDLGAFLLTAKPSKLIRGNFTLKALESVSGMEVFVAGPHRNGSFDFTSTSDFGHYNPEFLRWVNETLFGGGRSWETLGQLSQRLGLFPAFRDRLLSLSSARCAIAAKPDSFAQFKTEYRDSIRAGKRFSAYVTFAKWSDYSAGYAVEDLAFWARRDWDNTTPIVLEGLRRALLHVYHFSAYQGFVGCLLQGIDGTPFPIFFLPESFLDHEEWGDSSALSCREKLIRQHDWGIPERSAPNPYSGGNVRMDDRKTIIQTLTAAGCAETLITGPHYGLISNQGKLRWEPLELEFSLEFHSPECNCGPCQLVSLHVKLPETSWSPVLLRAGKPSTRPGYIISTEEHDEPQMSTTRLAFSETPPLASVYKVHERGRFEGDTEPRTVILKTTLWAELADGRKTKIEERYGIGKYTFAEPAIENITILDVNGDHGPDFLYDIDNLGRHLVLTKDGEILNFIQLITNQYSGVGGC